jgi:uncharacterized phiE125 gp8 family phage protein
MLSTVKVKTPPAKEPVALEIAKQHCRIDHASDDALIAIYITSARSMVQSYLNRALITQTLTWTLTPEDPLRPADSRLWGNLTLPRSPVSAINSVIATDTYGNVTTIAAAALPIASWATLLGYMADLAHSPAKLVIGGNTVLVDGRSLRGTALQHLQIEFVAGYGADPSFLDPPVANAVLMMVGYLYEHRGDDVAGLPMAVEWLLDPYRVIPI